VGDLVSATFAEPCYGLVMAAKKNEYFCIKWLDTGQEDCYPYARLNELVALDELKVVSTSRTQK